MSQTVPQAVQLPQIRLYKGKPDASPVLLGGSTPEGKAMKKVIHFAIKIINSTSGRRAFTAFLTRHIAMYRAKGLAILYPAAQDGAVNIANNAKIFLAAINREFPKVYLQRLYDDGESGFYPWAPADDAAFQGYATFTTDACGFLKISEQIVKEYVHAIDNGHVADQKIFFFQLVLTVVHELGHFANMFLTGARPFETPRQTPVPTDNGPTAWYYEEGESGFHLENELFGGSTWFIADPARGAEEFQPGLPVLRIGHFANPTGLSIPQAFFDTFFSQPTDIDNLLPVTRGPTFIASATPKDMRILRKERREKIRGRPDTPSEGGSNPGSTARNHAPVPVPIKSLFTQQHPDSVHSSTYERTRTISSASKSSAGVVKKQGSVDSVSSAGRPPVRKQGSVDSVGKQQPPAPRKQGSGSSDTTKPPVKKQGSSGSVASNASQTLVRR